MPDYYDHGIAVRVPSWHRKERLLDDHPRDWAHACELASMFEVEEKPFVHDDIVDDRWKVIVRTDSSAPVAVVRSSYQLINVKEMGEIISTVLDSEKGWKIDTLFSLYGGRMVACCIKLEDNIQVDGDPSKSYPLLTVSNGFGGNAAFKLSLTVVRAVCANTVQASETTAEHEGVQWVVRHTRNWEDKVHQLAERMQFSRIASIAMNKEMSRWNVVPVSAKDREAFFGFAAGPPESPGYARRLDGLFATSNLETNTMIGDTVYGLWTTVSEWADHTRAHRTTDSWINRQLLVPNSVKRQSWSYLRELAGTVG